MNLEQLKQAGAIVSAEPVEKEIVWNKAEPNGTVTEYKFKILVRRRAFGAVEKMFSGGSERSRSAALIAETVLLGDDGAQTLTYEEAYMLDPTLAFAFVTAINEVNKIGQEPPKN